MNRSGFLRLMGLVSVAGTIQLIPASNMLLGAVDVYKYPKGACVFIGLIDGDWNKAGNWLNNKVPQAGSDVVIDTEKGVVGNARPVGNLTIMNGGIGRIREEITVRGSFCAMQC